MLCLCLGCSVVYLSIGLKVLVLSKHNLYYHSQLYNICRRARFLSEVRLAPFVSRLGCCVFVFVAVKVLVLSEHTLYCNSQVCNICRQDRFLAEVRLVISMFRLCCDVCLRCIYCSEDAGAFNAQSALQQPAILPTLGEEPAEVSFVACLARMSQITWLVQCPDRLCLGRTS